MPVLFLALLITLTVQEIVFEVGRTTQVARNETEGRSIGSDLLIARNALSAYRSANPAAQGAVDLSALGLPGWFTPSTQIHVLIEGASGFVYYTPLDNKPDLMTMLGVNAPAHAGVARNGQLQSPRISSTILLPAAIPDGSIVLML